MLIRQLNCRPPGLNECEEAGRLERAKREEAPNLDASHVPSGLDELLQAFVDRLNSPWNRLISPT